MERDKNPILIASDLDGTIIDHTNAKIAIAKKYGYELSRKDTASVIINGVINNNEDLAVINKAVYAGQGVESVEFMPRVSEVLHMITEKFGPVAIISRRMSIPDNEHIYEAIEKYLKDSIKPEHVFFVGIDAEKDEVTKRLGVRVYIDDRIETLDCMPSVTHRFIFDPYRWHTEQSKYPRVSNWEEFGEIVSKLSL